MYHTYFCLIKKYWILCFFTGSNIGPSCWKYRSNKYSSFYKHFCFKLLKKYPKRWTFFIGSIIDPNCMSPVQSELVLLWTWSKPGWTLLWSWLNSALVSALILAKLCSDLKVSGLRIPQIVWDKNPSKCPGWESLKMSGIRIPQSVRADNPWAALTLK